ERRRGDEQRRCDHRSYGATHAAGDTSLAPVSDRLCPNTSTATCVVDVHWVSVIGTSKIRVAPGSTYQPGPSFVNVGAADPLVPLTEMVSTLTCRLPVVRTRTSTLPCSTETPSTTADREGFAGRTNTGMPIFVRKATALAEAGAD